MPVADERLPHDIALLLSRFASGLEPLDVLVGLYVGGSLASGDYHPGASDLDLAAIVSGTLDDLRQRELVSLHERLIREEPSAAKLHCVYVPVGEIEDLGAEHLYWAMGELYRHAFTGIARAELLRGGIVLAGPPPAALIPDITDEALKEAARCELSGYWSRTVAKPDVWLQDVFVDQGLTALARVEATLTEGRLITKTEALTRLGRFGVPDELVDEIGRRRNGETVELTEQGRVDRADTARRVMAAGIHDALGTSFHM
ncbi:MAG: hypothetical protein QOE05_2901 [Actinomycetota bacterium]|nr:hypothetical protein [Actinomycetota bacterium]